MFASASFRIRPEAGPALRRPSPKLVPLFLTALISACVTPKSLELPELSDWENRQDVLVGVDEWEFAGRIGVSAGDEGFNGQLRWRQDGVVFRARINGPLGIGTVFINGDRRKITVTDRNGAVTELHDAEVELRQMYGWTIPVTSLRSGRWEYPIRPAPQKQSLARTASSRSCASKTGRSTLRNTGRAVDSSCRTDSPRLMMTLKCAWSSITGCFVSWVSAVQTPQIIVDSIGCAPHNCAHCTTWERANFAGSGAEGA